MKTLKKCAAAHCRRRAGEALVFRHNCRKNCRKFIDISKKVIIIIFRMSAQTDKRSKDAISLASLGSHRHVVGAKQIRKALTAGTARRVFLARNADPAITEPLEALCKHNSVQYAWVKSMTDLGNACGIEVGAAAAAILA